MPNGAPWMRCSGVGHRHDTSASLKEELPLNSLPVPRPSVIPCGTGQMQDYSLQPVELSFHSFTFCKCRTVAETAKSSTLLD